MIKCPQCKSLMEPHKNPCRPFCSDRCKEIDLGRWFMGDYSVAATNVSTEELEVLEREIEKKQYDE